MTEQKSFPGDSHVSEMLSQLESAEDGFIPVNPTVGPIHTVYGGAHLFRRTSISRLSEIARNSFQTCAPSAGSLTAIFGITEEVASRIHPRIARRLQRQAIEDFRVDFEDGYGLRSPDEEDQHAVEAGTEAGLADRNDELPPFFGIRLRPLGPRTVARAARTLKIFMASFTASLAGTPRSTLLVTIPKLSTADQVRFADTLLSAIENVHGLAGGSLGLELMVESPSPLGFEKGKSLTELVEAANGRCQSVHFGAFDYLAFCGIPARQQDLGHPLCNHARAELISRLAGSGVRLVDGVTTLIPIEPHRQLKEPAAEKLAENQAAIRSAWKAHYVNVTRSLESGIYQSWDLHPAQIPARLAAVYNFFHDGLSLSSERLRNFIDKATKATTVGTVFDDAASAQGLLNHFSRAFACGALSLEETEDCTGLSVEEIQKGSFSDILIQRADCRQ